MKYIICKGCEYGWDYKGHLGMATCPNCSGKTKVKTQGEKQNENRQDTR